MEAIAACATKDEAPYLLEWLCYHKVIGFDRILIATNDNTDASPQILNQIAAAVPWLRVIEHSVTERTVPQMQAYRLIKSDLDREGFNGYVALFDVDEFLILHEKELIHHFLHTLDKADAIFVNWRIYGSSGHQNRPFGLVTETFTHCATPDFAEHRKFKCIFRYNDAITHIGVHWPIYKDMDTRHIVFTDGEPIDPLVLTEKPYSMHSRICLNGIQLNHYATKSKDEYKARQQRGRGDKSAVNARTHIRHTDQYFRSMNRNEIESFLPPKLILRTKKLMTEIYEQAQLSQIAPAKFFGLDKA